MDAKLSFGLWVKQRRKALDLTQHALAQRIGCALSTIQKIEIDARQPSQEMAALLADHLEIIPAERDAFLRLARRQPSSDQAILTAAPNVHAPFYNVPSPLTSLVGREWEMATLCAQLLQADVRLLTITGPPGIGKTRLALSVAQQIAHDGLVGETANTHQKFSNGVCFVALAPLADANFVFPTVVRTLGIKGVGNQPPLAQLNAYFRNKQFLLLLDNFEHVLPAAPLLTELLEAAPHLKVLVTSRALLHLYGEHEFVTPPLALPDLKALPAPQDLANYAAIELFIQRARAAKLDFVLNVQNAPAVAELCVRLDGLPLAIELAAARSKMLTPDKLQARLAPPSGSGIQLGLLASEARNLPLRQQTLRNAIAWSYELLNPTEQRVFRALGVFAGGCTVDALKAMVSDYFAGSKLLSSSSEEWLLSIVYSLINKSLVVHGATSANAPRFLLLEMMREFAWEQLEVCGELPAAQRAHAMYFLALAERFAIAGKLSQDNAAGETLEGEFDNLRSAIGWLTSCEPRLGLHLIAYASEFWCNNSLYSDARAQLEEALVRIPPEDSYPYALALGRLGQIAWMQGDHAIAQIHLEKSIRLWRALQNTYELGFFLQFLALALYNHNEYEAALIPAEEAVALLRTQSTLHWLAMALNALGIIHSALGDYERARIVQEECLALFRQANHSWGVGLALSGLVDIPYAAGDFVTARAYLQEALDIYRTLGDRWFMSQELWYLGKVVWQQGDRHQAIACWEESVALGRETGAKDFVSGSLLLLGFATQQAGKRRQAHAYFTESLTLYQQMAHNAGIAYALSGLAELCEKPVQSAQLLGATAALLASRRMLLDSLERSHYQRIHDEVRAQMDEAIFAAAWDAGQAMTLEEAVALALG